VSATNKVEISIINTTRGIKDKKTQYNPGSVKIGINAETVVSVQIITGDLYSWSDRRTAVLPLYHWRTFSEAPSMMIIIVSIAIPNASTNAKVVRLLNVSHK